MDALDVFRVGAKIGGVWGGRGGKYGIADGEGRKGEENLRSILFSKSWGLVSLVFGTRRGRGKGGRTYNAGDFVADEIGWLVLVVV